MTEETTYFTSSTDWTTTTTEHYQEILNRDIDRLLVVMTRIKEFLVSAQSNDTKREKREKHSSLSEEEKEMCSTLRWLPRKLGEIKDGGIYSLAKMKVASILKTENIDLLDGMTSKTVKECLIDIFRGDEEMKNK